MTDVLMTSIVLKTDVTLLDIVSTRMLGQFGFLAQVQRQTAHPPNHHMRLPVNSQKESAAGLAVRSASVLYRAA